MASSSVKYDPLLGKMKLANENVDELTNKINAQQTQINQLSDIVKSALQPEDMKEISDADFEAVFANV